MNFIKGLSKKTKIILICVIVFIILLIIANTSKKSNSTTPKGVTIPSTEYETDSNISEAELEQQALIKVFGNPPEGFRWNDDGEPIAISNENLTAEDVVYSFMRALSILDFETAQKYSSISLVINNYKDNYGVDASDSYYKQVNRQIYKEVLKSMEIEGISDSAVFANGQRVFTFKVKIYDLSNKDFWKDEADDIFKNLYIYNNSEADTTKAEQYVYSKILEYYQSGKATKKETTVDICLDKVKLGGWLVSDDTALNDLCSYRDGTSVYEYIMDCFSDWVDAKDR